MWYLIEKSSKKIVQALDEKCDYGGPLSSENYRWIQGAAFDEPIYNGDDIIEGISVEKKREKIFKTIDENTRALLGKYIEFDGHKFSVSLEAQLNWTAMNIEFAAGQNPMFPDSQTIPTWDNIGYILTKEKASDFMRAIYYGVKEKIIFGVIEKQKITKMTTLDQLKAYADVR